MQGEPGALTQSASIPGPTQVGSLCCWGISPMLQATMGVEPGRQRGAWVVQVGSLQASLRTMQPKYLAHDLHASTSGHH